MALIEALCLRDDPEGFRAAMEAGVAKFNADTDLRHAFRRGIEETWAQGDRQFEEAVARGRELMIDATVEKLRLYGCAGKAGAGTAGVTA